MKNICITQAQDLDFTLKKKNKLLRVVNELGGPAPYELRSETPF